MSERAIVTYGLSAEDVETVGAAVRGYERRLVHVDDAQAARAAIETYAPPVLFLDAAEPVGDGYALCREWKAAHPETAVVIVARDDELETKLEAVTAGADQFLISPIDEEALEFVLRFFLVEKAT